MTAPCFGCGSKRRERDACPNCAKVVCDRCAEKPTIRGYACCCDAPGGKRKSATTRVGDFRSPQQLAALGEDDD